MFYKPPIRRPLIYRQPSAQHACGGIGGGGDDLIIIGNGTSGPPGPAGPPGPQGPAGPSGTQSGIIPVRLVNTDYDCVNTDYYIGATEKNITITLPAGQIGRIFVVKNQTDGNVRVEGTNGEKLDDSSFKILGTEGSLMVVFVTGRWNLI